MSKHPIDGAVLDLVELDVLFVLQLFLQEREHLAEPAGELPQGGENFAVFQPSSAGQKLGDLVGQVFLGGQKVFCFGRNLQPAVCYYSLGNYGR